MSFEGTLHTDLLVIGGGINGAGIARDAAGRGFGVVLCEQHDLAQHTSSASTKLVHGGLRYIEQYDFGLVRKALLEREVLLDAAPHIMWPLRFVMPHDAHLRPAWLIRAGLFLYDHLAPRRRLAASCSIDLRRHPAGAALRSQYARGFEYSDGWVDDARLVVLNAMDAEERGAVILTRTRFEAAHRSEDGWHALLAGPEGTAHEVRARAIVNAAGPWAAQVLGLCGDPEQRAARPLRLVKGSHIVVPRLFEHEYAYIFQNPDRRIIFAIPYEDEFTLIGTTDVDFDGDPAEVAIDAAERQYLCQMASRYFRREIGEHDIVASYSGVRPLLDDDASNPAGVTRDYTLEVETAAGAPLLSVFGGKITTYRRLAEEAVDRIAALLHRRAHRWSAGQPLPGGEMPAGDFARFLAGLRARVPWLPAALATRYARAYGTRVDAVLAGARRLADLGEQVVPGLHAAEIGYLRRNEYAQTARDILWRRSKLALHVPADAEAHLDEWLAAHPD